VLGIPPKCKRTRHPPCPAPRLLQVVLKRAHDFDAIKGGVEGKIVEYANRGFRALGIGYAESGCHSLRRRVGVEGGGGVEGVSE